MQIEQTSLLASNANGQSTFCYLKMKRVLGAGEDTFPELICSFIHKKKANGSEEKNENFSSCQIKLKINHYIK